MAYITTAPISKVDAQTSLELTFAAALEHARRLTDMYGANKIEVALAWETVDELRVAIARRKASVQTTFARYCTANPDAPECRIYDA